MVQSMGVAKSQTQLRTEQQTKSDATWLLGLQDHLRREKQPSCVSPVSSPGPPEAGTNQFLLPLEPPAVGTMGCARESLHTVE